MFGGIGTKTFWSVVLIFAGGALLLRNLGYIPGEAWQLWPVFLMLIGLVGIVDLEGDKKKK